MFILINSVPVVVDRPSLSSICSCAVLRTSEGAEKLAKFPNTTELTGISRDLHYLYSDCSRNLAVRGHVPVLFNSYKTATVAVGTDGQTQVQDKLMDITDDFYGYDIWLASTMEMLGKPLKLGIKVSGPAENGDKGSFLFYFDATVTDGIKLPPIRPVKRRCTREDLLLRIHEFMTIVKRVHGKGKVTITFEDSRAKLNECWIFKAQ